MSKAKQFYGALFGWSADDQDTRGGPPYAMFRLEGRTVAGLGELNEAMKSQGIPPTWNSYLAVDDIEAAVACAAELGATVIVPVMPVLDAGWLAFVQDPGGAVVALWRENRHAGAEMRNEPGSFCWNELATRDIEASRRFYGTWLGWEFEEVPGVPSKYYAVKTPAGRAGGMIQMTADWGEMPSRWSVYFAVRDVDVSAERVRQLGGTVCVPPFDISVGRMTVCNDPQGATFTLIRLDAEA
jgi:predicted enzyme related to lactoylglutathione lyase